MKLSSVWIVPILLAGLGLAVSGCKDKEKDADTAGDAGTYDGGPDAGSDTSAQSDTDTDTDADTDSDTDLDDGGPDSGSDAGTYPDTDTDTGSVQECGETEVSQPGTDLCWFRCPMGRTWDGSECTGDTARKNWNDAMATCPDGYSLPTRDQFMALLGNCDSYVTGGSYGSCDSCSASSTCNGMFGSDEEVYWTSTLREDNPDFAWHVYFSSGYVFRVDISGNDLFAALCLRVR